MLIKPNSKTKISNGSCVVNIINNSQLIIFSDEKDKHLLSSYINGSVTISSGGAVYARSEKTNLTIDVIDLSSSGVKGDKGEQGIPGVKGAQGIQGVKGVDGKAGAKGDPILNIKDSKPLKIWAGTAEELALVVTKAPDVVYFVTGEIV